jgi:hypothetical protein
MISAEQARKDLVANEMADWDQHLKDEAKKAEAQRKEVARALKEDVPKMIADIEAKIYKAVAARENSVKYQEEASPAVSVAFDAVKKELEAHGYKVLKDYHSGTMDMSDECRGIPYEKYILYITW